jgi:hypothetical protein
MENQTAPIRLAAERLGAYAIAAACGVKGPSVYKWLANGFLPRTEWTGETNYAQVIQDLSQGEFTRDYLLSWKPTRPSVPVDASTSVEALDVR